MSDPDHNIIRQILAGNPRAFAVLVDRHKSPGMTVAMADVEASGRRRRSATGCVSFGHSALFERFEFSIEIFDMVSIASYIMSVQRHWRKRGTDIAGQINDSDENEVLTIASHDENGPIIAVETSEFRTIVMEEIAALPARYSGMLTLFFVGKIAVTMRL